MSVKLPPALLFIDNKFVPSVSGKTFTTVNPATGEVIASVAQADAADVELAVASARRAFASWGSSDGAYRASFLFKVASLIERDAKEIAALETLDNGMNAAMAVGVIQTAAQSFRFFAGLGDKLEGRYIPFPNQHVYTRREPYGVCAGVVPWNFPFLLTVCKLAPGLVAGNTFIIKPSEKTPLTALRLAELFVEAGLPAGVLSVLPGFGDVGAVLSAHQDVDKLSFTGSVVTGKKIMEAAARSNLKKVSLELGGKSPTIVCEDADVAVAVELAHHALFVHQGQVCVAGSRVFVHEKLYDEFVRRSVERAKVRAKSVGTGPTHETGPIIDQIQLDRVLGYIEAGKNEGAKLLCGGQRHGDKGFFIEPTVFSDVKDDMKIAKEEIFGPVMSIFKFSDYDDVVRRANDTEFGLAARIITNNLKRAHSLAAVLRAGTVAVNSVGAYNIRAPFGGFKQSGIGRENGIEGLDEYLVTKSVCVALM